MSASASVITPWTSGSRNATRSPRSSRAMLWKDRKHVSG
jgi:hypothetical protein